MEALPIWLVGGTEAARTIVEEVLDAAGFRNISCHSGLPSEGDHPPALIICCGDEAELCCREARALAGLAKVPLLAVVSSLPPERAASAIAAGADDVAIMPPTAAVLGNRARRLIRAAIADRQARAAAGSEESLRTVFEILADDGDSPEGLRDALLVAARFLEFDRASLISHEEGSDKAFVIAATDDPTLTKFQLAIDQYPELVEAFTSRAPLLIADAQNNPLTREVRDAIAAKGIRAVVAFPVMWQKRMLGVVLFRRARAGLEHINRQRLSFARLFAGTIAARLADSKVISSLREQTHRISLERYETERRLRAIGTLKEYFDAASDGVVVLDELGRILFVNRAAEPFTGAASDGLLGTAMEDIVALEQRAELRDVVGRVIRGLNVEAFELELLPVAGTQRSVSVATSTVLSSQGAVILVLRDVTEDRALETELRKTKDFLERLIDSTVDAIVAADTSGRIILFNPGAERVYGYLAEDVIGQLHVDALYPPGVAEQIMRMLRSASYGGVGRLEQTRRELVTHTGELVPVNMTASIIYEGGKEVATVGIFSDLRERIRIEQRLLQAQEKLILSEKQGLVAELAGAAAHELNQPLTSILGYVELIERRLEQDSPHARAIQTIRGEAERMAELVKKIGRITRYETKEYVGSANILDLDKSSEDPA